MNPNLDKVWPLSLEEMQGIAKPLAAKLSFSTLAHKYCRKIESVASVTFTHRCTCPNPFHKNGGERTPSFYFSDKDKFYKCFGCNISGDIFDFITLTEGIPWHISVTDMLQNGDINIQSLQEAADGLSDIELANYLFDLNLDISNNIREYLITRRETTIYEAECKWADHLLKRIDETFIKLIDSNFEQAKAFHSQVLMEISRREMLVADKLQDKS